MAKKKKWAPKAGWSRCKKCERTDREHWGQGYCKNCYAYEVKQKNYRAKRKAEEAKEKGISP